LFIDCAIIIALGNKIGEDIETGILQQLQIQNGEQDSFSVSL
jgi:hypothetical protein